jgi:hypothetical protein
VTNVSYYDGGQRIQIEMEIDLKEILKDVPAFHVVKFYNSTEILDAVNTNEVVAYCKKEGLIPSAIFTQNETT